MDNNNSEVYRDWIPAGEDTGAITDNGFQDYVPAPEPKPQTVTEQEEPEPMPEPTVPPLESEKEGEQDGSA